MSKNGCCCGGDHQEEKPAQESCCCGDSAVEEHQDCCCGDGGSDGSCCCGDSDCCGGEPEADDPNTGHKEVVIVDYLYLDLSVCERCQGIDERVAKAVELVRPIMDMAGYNIVMNKVEIADEALAERFEFLSSPTVRVNGVDICPTVIENECCSCRTLSDYEVNCRQFAFNGKLYEVPPTAYIVQRLLQIVLRGEKPAYEPYQMPENIRGFLRGKHDQAGEQGTQAGSGCCCC